MANPYENLSPLEIFRKVAFELKSYPDDVVSSYIEMAQAMFCSAEYGDQENLFLALMAAHLMVIPGGIAASSGTGSAPAGVKSVKEGDLTITYQDSGKSTADASTFKAWLGQSRFGQLLIQIRRQLGLGIAFTVAAGYEACADGYYFPNRGIH